MEVIIIVIAIIFCVIVLIASAKDKVDEKVRNENIEKIMAEMMNEKKQLISSLSNKYNKTPIIIDYDIYDPLQMILIFKDKRIIYLENKEYRFEDILEFSVVKYESNGQAFETKTSLGGLVSRSLIGGVVAGPMGAIIGGATANKKTESIPTYNRPPELKIIVNNLDNPLIVLRNPFNLDMIVSTLTVIMKNN